MSQRRWWPLGVIALAASATAGGGCASIWAMTEIMKDKPPLETDQENWTVPLPGVTERLRLHARLADAGLEVDCHVTQTGKETQYHVSTYYGNSWKLLTALAFVVEGGIVALNFQEGVHGAGPWVGVTWMSIDALGSGILFFMPERRVLERSPREETIAVRDSCPSGLTLDAAGRPLPIDVDGHADEKAQTAVDEQMAAPAPSLRLQLAGWGADLPISRAKRCTWARKRAPAQVAGFCASTDDMIDDGVLDLTLDLPVGTATGMPPAITVGP